jgi:NADPH2:quinone reductase
MLMHKHCTPQVTSPGQHIVLAMKAIQFKTFGAPGVLEFIELPKPQAVEGSAIVRVHSSSANPSDVKNVSGLFGKTTLPRIPGRDFSGVVVEGPSEWLGPEVWETGGDIGFTRDGGQAEFLRIPAAALARKPESLSHEQASAVGVNFVVAWLGTINYAKVTASETIVVIGVGGADVVYDTVGGVAFEQALHMVKQRGRVIEISATGMRRVAFDLIDFYRNETQIFGADSAKRGVAESALTMEALRDNFDRGSYRPPFIGQRFPLEAAKQAYEAVASGVPGRVVINI